MSIEQTLERIAAALETIAAGKSAPVHTVIPLTAVKVEVKPPVEIEIPVLIPVAPTPVAAPIPAFIAPVVAPVATAIDDCPIKDGKSLLDTIMGVYKTLGSVKGAQIQNILNSLGCQAVNEIRPDQYRALWDGLNALKNS